MNEIKLKKYIGVLVFLILGFWVTAQTQDPTSPGFDFNMLGDSTDTQSTDESIDGEKAADAVAVKPYERIVLAMDTMTNLIIYTGVIEQEESSSDSLYSRAKNYASKRFALGAKDGKGLFEVDKKNQKLVINAVMPAYSYANKYAKKPMGTYQFKLTIFLKEGRYKYLITNLLHEGVKPNVGVPTRNYFEYYYTTTTNVRGVDQILRYADKDINAMIESLKKAMREQIVLDEDEW